MDGQGCLLADHRVPGQAGVSIVPTAPEAETMRPETSAPWVAVAANAPSTTRKRARDCPTEYSAHITLTTMLSRMSIADFHVRVPRAQAAGRLRVRQGQAPPRAVEVERLRRLEGVPTGQAGRLFAGVDDDDVDGARLVSGGREPQQRAVLERRRAVHAVDRHGRAPTWNPLPLTVTVVPPLV